MHPRERADIDTRSLSHLRLYDERTYGSTLLMFFEHAAAPDPAQQSAQQPTQEKAP
jgi:hypothetical protein